MAASTETVAKAGRARQTKRPRKSKAKPDAAAQLAQLNQEQRQRGHSVAMQKQAIELAERAGVDPPAWAAAPTSNRSSKRKTAKQVKPAIAEAVELANAATGDHGKPLSQKLRPVEVESIAKQLAKMGDVAKTPKLLGFKSEAAMRRVVTGVAQPKDETADGGEACKAFHRAVATHQLWMRKSIVGAWGVYRQATGKAA